MLPMSVTEIAAATGGVWKNARTEVPSISSVSTDSRKIDPGCLFVALTGDAFDGNDYIPAALDAGAAGCICSKLPETLRPDKFYIQVSDTNRALGDLAGAYRKKFSIPVIQLTGSVGKTSTKEMIASVLGAKLRVCKTPGNYNNHVGVPLTLLGLEQGDQAAVVETGMNHFGEIDYLGGMVCPDIAVITNIGDAHIEFLGSRQGILQAKCEIFNHLKKDGLVILNGDDELLNTITPPFRTIRCGHAPHCQVRITDLINHGVDGIDCEITTEKSTYHLSIPAPGEYMLYTAAIAVAVGEELGLSREEIERGVAAYEPSGSRMRVVNLSEGRILLDDCYNASPQSVTAALEVLARTECEKRLAVLGDMGELGGLAEQAHYNVGALAAMLAIDYVVAIGERAAGIADGAEQNGGDACHFATKEAAMEEIFRQMEPGTAVLVKASHAMRFNEIAAALRERYET